MAHVRAYGDQCPEARAIIHLGATSSFVGDNTDIILMHRGLAIIRKLLLNTIDRLAGFAERYKALPVLGYTHFQPAQPATLGKRAALWISDLLMDLDALDFTAGNLKLLGCKGATGTAASFLQLFDGDHGKVLELEKRIARKMGFDGDKIVPVSSQTYSRKTDYFVISVLSGIAQSAHKFSNDIRLLSHEGELEEPFGDSQIGSSAMAYKRNPVKAERIAALSRHLMVLVQDAAFTAAGQWLERSLDDSANRRIAIPEAFLAADAILNLYISVAEGLMTYPAVIKKHLDERLPFMATENILMYCTAKGGDRQTLHEAIRAHSMEAAQAMKRDGAGNDLLERILADPAININKEELDGIMAAGGFTGRAEEQAGEYLTTVRKVLDENRDVLGYSPKIRI
jgi:adenylosuccinate lyase